jgi:tetratricopeptide (TPR) repeat protein
MSITGNLRTMDAAEVLQWLANGSKTGTLVLGNGQVEKKIYFQRGAVIMTASSNPKEYLGHFLVSHGLIDEKTLVKAMDMQQSNKMLLGKILVTIGAISESELDRMLRLKLEESVYEIFTWPEGDFQFLDGQLPQFTMIPLQLNINALLLEGVQRADEWARIRLAIPSNQVVPVAVAALEAPADDHLAAKVLNLVDDDRTIEEIALHAHASEFHVCRVVMEAARKGLLKVVRPRPVEVPVQREAPRERVDAESLLGAGRSYLEAGDLEQALRHCRAALSLQPQNETIQKTVAAAERELKERLEKEGIRPEVVPKLTRRLEDLATLDITPHEGFILTRVNGTYDIRTILKISPISPLDALLVFRRLRDAGYVSLS